ncbi:hypothetical protein M426DRAFT_319984 [Hypoxylon sp. CI-4A]|nr:hypothetical protein M426DRAFT_319984 [Hypoxylon sp. CI-4A]
MPNRGTKRKASPSVTSDGSAAKDKANRKKAKNDLKRLSHLDDDEDDEDEGRQGSRNFQQWAQFFESHPEEERQKSEKFLKNYQTKAQKQACRLQDHTDRQNEKFGVGSQSIEGFEALYSAASFFPGTNNSRFLSGEAKSILSGGYSLIKRFKETEEQLRSRKLKLPAEKWQQDKKLIRDIFTAGLEYGETLVEDKLKPNTYPPHQLANTKMSEKNKTASELFKSSRDDLDEENWGTIAADQVKRISAIAKTVPLRESERVGRRI